MRAWSVLPQGSKRPALAVRPGAALIVLSVLIGVVASTGTSASASTFTSARGALSRAAATGGTLNEAVVGALWPTLDPVTDNQDVADAQFLNLVYGELFQSGPHAKLLPDIATGYRYADNDLQIDINIRPGVHFSDGHALTAAVVAWSMNRDLSQPSNFAANFTAVKPPVTSSGNTVVLNLSNPDSAILEAFVAEPPNWIVDPYALTQMGTGTYGQRPVGAGPFKVKSNTANQSLDLVRNPQYWQHGRPRLAAFNILDVSSDESAYSALQTGQVQMMGGVNGVTTFPLIKQIQAKGTYNVVLTPATTYQFVSMNQTQAPFNNILAREALVYATNPAALVNHLYRGLYKVVQGPTAPAELYYYGPDVPGYPHYNLAKAKALVKQLGGLSFTLITTSNTQYWDNEAVALQSEWSEAGIHAHVVLNTLTQTLQELSGNHWQALDSNWGIYADPGAALPYYFSSKGQASGTHDPALDNLIAQGVATTNPTSRLAVYKTIGRYMAQHFDADFLYDKPTVQIATKKVGWLPKYGTTYGEILWQDVYLTS